MGAAGHVQPKEVVWSKYGTIACVAVEAAAV